MMEFVSWYFYPLLQEAGEASQEFGLASARLCFWGDSQMTISREMRMLRPWDAAWCHGSPKQWGRAVIPILRWGN